MQIRFGDFTESVRVTSEAAPVLAAQLATAAPPDATTEEKKRLHEVQVEGQNVSDVVVARERAAPSAVRPLMIACVGAWSGAYEVTTGKARLDPTVSDEGAKAKILIKAFFSDGVPVSFRDAPETFGVSRRLLGRIDDEKLAKTFESVVGADLLALIRSTTETLGEGIGAGETRRAPVPNSTALQDALVRFGRTVGAYCRLLAAKVDEDDPRSVQRFLSAVAPIDAYRASRGPSDAGGDAPVDGVAKPEAVTNGTPASPSA